MTTALEPMRFHQTYEVITEESAINGEAEERGFDWEDGEETFRELIHRLRTDYRGASVSDSPARPRWITAHGDMDLQDGSFRNISLHPANERARRWWPKALKAARII